MDNTNYIITNGTAFHPGTDERMRSILSGLVHSGRRVRIYYGDTETGVCWMDEWGTIGTVGRSCGDVKIPLLICRKDSLGGAAILDDCVIRLVDIESGEVLYSHPAFHLRPMSTDGCRVFMEGKLYANCETQEQAQRLFLFMSGKRNTKGGRLAGV